MFTKEVKGKVGIAFVTKQILGSDHCYLGLRPTVKPGSDTTSITPGFKDKTECIAICMPGSSFIHIETL